jgi:peptidase E
MLDFGLVEVFRAAWNAGTVLSGTSAGAICWFEGCITDSLPLHLKPLPCFGFLKGSHCTHYDARPDRPPQFQHSLRSGEIPYPGLATDNDVAVHFIGDNLLECVTQRSGAKAVRYVSNGEALQEVSLPVRLLS